MTTLKKRFGGLLAMALCLSMLFAQSAFAATAGDTELELAPAATEDNLTKEEYYEIFCALVEERNATYQIINVVPASFEEFGLCSMEKIEDFLELCDELDAWQVEIAPELEAHRAEYYAMAETSMQNDLTSIQTVKREAITTGIKNFAMRIVFSAKTMINSTTNPEYQRFDPSTCAFTITTVKHDYGTWVTTADFSGISGSKGQEYIVDVIGTLQIPSAGDVGGLGLSTTFRCNDKGVIS